MALADQSSGLRFSQSPPLSLYIHLPWCVRKCPYCDFNSHEAGREGIPEQEYLAALIADLNWLQPQVKGRPISTIFIGGGTPSLFTAASMQQLMAAIRDRMELADDAEITLEANPGAVDSARFEGFRAAGINRLSIGVQSFDNSALQTLGRIHDAATAVEAVTLARAAGFDQINIDLMYGLPGQDASKAMADLEQGLSLQLPHLSWYQLTLEPNTVFFKFPPVLPADDELWQIQEQGQSLLAASGYTQYEISAYAIDGHQCRHNLNYWTFGDYLAIGAGAHAKLTDISINSIQRTARHRLPARYMALAGTAGVVVDNKLLQIDDVILEFMMNNLRLRDGFSLADFSQRTGLPATVLQIPLERARELNWLVREDDHIRPTQQGQNYLNDLLHLFMLDNSSYSSTAIIPAGAMPV